MIKTWKKIDESAVHGDADSVEALEKGVSLYGNDNARPWLQKLTAMRIQRNKKGQEVLTN